MIYLDMDDVCCDTTHYALRFLGCDVEPTIYSLTELAGLKEEDIWNQLGYDFWRTIPESKEFEELKMLLRGWEFAILTGVPPYNKGACVDGKYKWVKTHFDDNIEIIFCTEKWRLAKKGDLLIDDLECNVEDFKWMGGEAILVPRPWNSGTGLFLDNIQLHLDS